jgi:hypothetical protein
VPDGLRLQKQNIDPDFGQMQRSRAARETAAHDDDVGDHVAIQGRRVDGLATGPVPEILMKSVPQLCQRLLPQPPPYNKLRRSLFTRGKRPCPY